MNDWVPFDEEKPPENEVVELRYWRYNEVHQEPACLENGKMKTLSNEKVIAHPLKWKRISEVKDD